MKTILLGSILAMASLGTCGYASADVSQPGDILVTPKIGYVASTDGASGRDKRDNIEGGIGIGTKVAPNTTLEVEYLRSGDRRKYDTTSLNVYQNITYSGLGTNNYIMGGVGYAHPNSHHIGNEVAVQYGIGHRFVNWSPLPIKAEIRSVHYLDNHDDLNQRSHEMQALIGTEFRF